MGVEERKKTRREMSTGKIKDEREKWRRERMGRREAKMTREETLTLK